MLLHRHLSICLAYYIFYKLIGKLQEDDFAKNNRQHIIYYLLNFSNHMTKSISMMAIGFSMLVAAVPALAAHQTQTLSVKNTANIANVSVSLSNTGLNSVGSRSRRGTSSLTTGAASADAQAVVTGVNMTDPTPHTNVTNKANILNVSGAIANTGLNSSSGRLHTGDASATSYSEVSNVNVTGFGLN